MCIQGLLRRTVYHVRRDAKLPLICSPNLYSTCGNVDTVHTHILAMTVSSRPQAIHCLRVVLMISSYGDNEGTTINPYKRMKAVLNCTKQLGIYHVHCTLHNKIHEEAETYIFMTSMHASHLA